MVLRAALDEAVAEGRLRRSPAARVGCRWVVKPDRVCEVRAWTEGDVRRFFAAIKEHRWYGPIRLYGLRPSELLGLKWGDVDLKAGTVRIERALTGVRGGPTWIEGKNARSRRTIPIDPTTAQHVGAHRRQARKPRRRQHVGRQRPRRGQQHRHGRGAGELRADPRTARAPSRRPSPDVARPAPPR